MEWIPNNIQTPFTNVKYESKRIYKKKVFSAKFLSTLGDLGGPRCSLR